MGFNYIFIGLPGVGKTTALKKIIEKNYPGTTVVNMDDHVKARLNALGQDGAARDRLSAYSTEDHLINKICRKWIEDEGYTKESVLDALTRKGFEKHSSAVMKYLGEPTWRELEARIAADYIKTLKEAAFDLGASQPLHPKVQKACIKKAIQFVYLSADHETIKAHLLTPQADGKLRWQQISNFFAAGEAGWEQLARDQRETRVPLYENLATDITIDVSNLSEEEVFFEISKTLQQYELKLRLSCFPQASSSSQSVSDVMDTPPSYRPSSTPQPREPQRAKRRLAFGSPVQDDSNADRRSPSPSNT